MRLVTFDKGGHPTSGVRKDDAVVDLSIAAPDLPGDWPAIFAAGALDRVAEAVAGAGPEALVPAAEATLMVPIPRPPKILCIGLNYRTHAEETGMEIPDYPIVFTRYPTSLTAHAAPLLRPAASHQLDFEAELVAVIGTAGRHISKERALDHVAGYSICNEGSVRDFQFKSSQWAMGKNFDRSGSIGPWMVTADEFAGYAGLQVTTRVNGEVRQDDNTANLIFDFPYMINYLSTWTALKPGDVLRSEEPSSVIDTLGSVASGVKPFLDQANVAMSQLNEILSTANTERISQIISNMESTSSAAHDVTVGLSRTQQQVDAAIGKLSQLLDSNQSEVDHSIKDVHASLEAIARHIDAISHNLEATTRNMNEFSAQIRENPGVLIRGRSAGDEVGGDR